MGGETGDTGAGESKVVDLMAALERSVREARDAARAERDRKRAETEAFYEEQFQQHRREYIEVVRQALDTTTCGPEECATAAVDALIAAGYVFCTLETSEDDRGPCLCEDGDPMKPWDMPPANHDCPYHGANA